MVCRHAAILMGNCGDKCGSSCCDTVCPKMAHILTRPKLLAGFPMEDTHFLARDHEQQQQQHSRSSSSLEDLVARREKIDGRDGSELSFVAWLGQQRYDQQAQQQREQQQQHQQQQQLSSRLDVLEELQIYVVTWNMNGKAPPLNLAKLIDDSGARHDVYVIGLQEAPSCYIDSMFLRVLGDNYCLVASSTMSSLQIYVFARTSRLPYIADAKTDKIGVGMGGVVGRQKGAVAVALTYFNIRIMFLCSHLAPHEGNVEARNSQYTRICSSVFTRPHSPNGVFPCIQPRNGAVADDSGLKNYHRQQQQQQQQQQQPQMLYTNAVEESDLVIWIGDLNYRVSGHQRDSVNVLINNNLEKLLWSKDQLMREIQQGRVFHNFKEGPLTFRPTYKYDVGTDDYDTSAKERIPSWTDRILFKVKPKTWFTAEIQDYNCIDSLKTSDHRPVKGLLLVKVTP